jgi:hypothetical protein
MAGIGSFAEAPQQFPAPAASAADVAAAVGRFIVK